MGIAPSGLHLATGDVSRAFLLVGFGKEGEDTYGTCLVGKRDLQRSLLAETYDISRRGPCSLPVKRC